MNTEGNQKQEDKVKYLSAITHNLIPSISQHAFTDMFHRGVESALKTNHYATWQEVVFEQPPARKSFFHDILGAMIPSLQASGLTKERIDRLMSQLIKKNRRFLG